jgi:type IV pilus assembly protein PilQ
LPRVVTTDVANPFTPDATDEAAAPGREADASANAAQPSSTARNEAESKRQGEARTDALEGPPVPLPPPRV